MCLSPGYKEMPESALPYPFMYMFQPDTHQKALLPQHKHCQAPQSHIDFDLTPFSSKSMEDKTLQGKYHPVPRKDIIF